MTPPPKRPEALTSKQRKALRGLAHDLEPVVTVGKEGIGEEVIAAVDAALGHHELIKVRVLESAPVDRREAGEALAGPTGAQEVGVVGRIVMLYRRHPSEPKIPLR